MGIPSSTTAADTLPWDDRGASHSQPGRHRAARRPRRRSRRRNRDAAEHRARQSLVRRERGGAPRHLPRPLGHLRRHEPHAARPGYRCRRPPARRGAPGRAEGHPPPSARARAEPGRGGSGARGGRPLRGGLRGRTAVRAQVGGRGAGRARCSITSRPAPPCACCGPATGWPAWASSCPTSVAAASRLWRSGSAPTPSGSIRYTRTDGLTSIRRGYSAGELRELLRSAGVRGRVSRRPGYRLVATWRTGG